MELEYMEFGHRTLQAVEQIYSSQYIKILVNNELIKPIPIHKGMRQAHPLSPLLFIHFLFTGSNSKSSVYKRTQVFGY